MRSLAPVLILAACGNSSSAPKTDLDKFADTVRPVATATNKLKSDIDAFKSGFHSPTALFDDDGPLQQLSTLYAALQAPRVAIGSGPGKECADAWYAAADKIKDIVGDAAKTIDKIQKKVEDPGMSTLLKLAAEWERKSDDFHDGVCALATAASTCVIAFNAANIDSAAIASFAVAMKTADCGK